MVPACAIAVLSLVGFDSERSPSTALSRPRFRSIGFIPAATAFRPSRIIAWASTVAVPSPATSEVFDATSLTICAPMFSNLSSSHVKGVVPRKEGHGGRSRSVPTPGPAPFDMPRTSRRRSIVALELAFDNMSVAPRRSRIMWVVRADHPRFDEPHDERSP